MTPAGGSPPGDDAPVGGGLPEHDALRWLLDVAHTLPPADLGAAIGRAMEGLGASRADVYVADHDQLRLHPFGRSALPSIEIDASAAGDAYMWERTQTEDGDRGGLRVWAPLIDGTARLGVVRVDMPGGWTGDGTAVRAVERVASLAAELLVAKGHYTDAVELARRHRTMTLAAELQRSNLPPAAVVTPDVAVAAVLQPAYEVAGDSFDYALNADGLHVAILDSVGHDLDSSLVSHVVQGSLRNSRRNGLDLPETYAVADEALAGLYPDHRFATAAFGRLDHASGVFRWISAGHPAPLVIRGGTVVGEAATVPTVPIGLRHRADPVVNEVELAPGDALVLYTDGVVEGGVRGGERFGLGRFVEVLDRFVGEGLPPAEVLRRVIVAVLTHTAHELHDDASIVLVQRRDAAPGDAAASGSAGVAGRRPVP